MAATPDDLVADFARDHRLPSVVAGLVDREALVWSLAVGSADLSGDVPASTATVYRIGSITKPFTATAIMQLATDDALTLDDPLAHHLPEFSEATNPYGSLDQVTIRRLLTHQSGLPVESPAFDWATRRFPSPEELVDGLGEVQLVVEPATDVKYSNFGYELLGEVIARAGGRPFREHVRDRILEPLGMHDTTFDPNDAGDHMAQGHDPPAFTDSPAPSPDRLKATDADGGLCSTVGDLARFVSAQFAPAETQDGILPGRMLAEMHRPRRLLDGGWTQAIGLGWRIFRTDGEVRVGHAGGTFGFTAKAVFSVTRRRGAIVLTNGEGPVADLADALMDSEPGDATGNGADTARVGRSAPPEEVVPLLGLYAWEDHSAPAAVEWVGGRLTIAWIGTGPRGDHHPRILEPTDDPLRFIVRGGRETGEDCRFSRLGDGRIAGLTIGGWPLVRLITAE